MGPQKIGRFSRAGDSGWSLLTGGRCSEGAVRTGLNVQAKHDFILEFLNQASYFTNLPIGRIQSMPKNLIAVPEHVDGEGDALLVLEPDEGEGLLTLRVFVDRQTNTYQRSSLLKRQ